MIGERKPCLEEGGSPSPVQGSVCLKRFVTILTHVSRWTKRNGAEHGKTVGKKREGETPEWRTGQRKSMKGLRMSGGQEKQRGKHSVRRENRRIKKKP